jgi:hypothetical protein
MLQADYSRGTKDSDILETVDLDEATKLALAALAGPNTSLYRRHRMYVEIVPAGLPFLPQTPQWLEVPLLNSKLGNFRLEVLSIVDVVVSKLMRFHANDERDIAAMVEGNLVQHLEMVSRFKLAVDYHSHDARAGNLPRIVVNLHRVERDLFGLPESDIELPDWLDC